MYGRAHTHHAYVLQYEACCGCTCCPELPQATAWLNLLKNLGAYAFSKGHTAFSAYSRQVVKKAGHLPRSLKTCSFSCGLLEGKGHVCVSSMSITIETTRPTWFCLCCVFFFFFNMKLKKKSLKNMSLLADNIFPAAYLNISHASMHSKSHLMIVIMTGLPEIQGKLFFLTRILWDS